MRSLTSFSTSATCCGGERGAVEVEGQLVRAHEGALLRRVAAHDLVQRPVQQVRDGVMALDGRATGRIDRERPPRAHRGRVVALDEMQPGAPDFWVLVTRQS
jgi:hypothetical protein